MSNQSDEEIKYLLDIINDVQYHKHRFKLMCGEDRYVFGVVSGKEALGPAPFSKLMKYKTLYDTLRDLDYKIKISFCKAIELAYSDAFNEFSLIEESTTEQQNTYYYIENALFRTSILWDLLAQFYRLYYDIEIDKTKVYYSQIFNPDKEINDKFKEKAREIHKYICEEDDTDCEGEWKGNHKFVNEQRNKMTHRNSPNVGVMSDFDINLKMHPAFILKRIIEDYSVVSKQLLEILNLIEKDEMDNFDEIISNE